MLDDQDWGSFKRKLKAKTEIDLDLYKEPQMKRRIGSLVTRKGYDSYTKYFDMATQDKTEFDAFIEYLTIAVEVPERENHLKYLMRERRTGRFERSFAVDGIKWEESAASMENGILKVVLPKLGVEDIKKNSIEIK